MRIRKRIEEPFGWIKTIGGGRQLRYRGRQRNRAWFKITTAVYNLLRITALDTLLARLLLAARPLNAATLAKLAEIIPPLPPIRSKEDNPEDVQVIWPAA